MNKLNTLTKKGKQKPKMMNQHHQSFMQNLYVQINKQKILSLFRTKGQQNVDPFEYLTQYCKVKMALMIEIN